MFAGPNGSGKSTIKEVVPPELLGLYINPDELEIEIKATGFFDLAGRGISATTAEVRAFFAGSTLTAKADVSEEISKIVVAHGKIDLRNVKASGYWASLTSDFLRHKLLEVGESFTFETVMSSSDKVAFLRKAQEMGYRTYLYYVATGDPEINVFRVQSRVALGGHGVPEEKIRSRYERSLELLPQAIKASNRAYIFDNSQEPGSHFLVAEFEDGLLKTTSDSVPRWFHKAVIEKSEKSD